MGVGPTPGPRAESTAVCSAASMRPRVLAPFVLGAAILAASGPWASADHTGQVTEPWLSWLGLPPVVAAAVHRGLRKLGHALAYGLFAALVFRALPSSRRPAWRALVACATALALASVDEALQSLHPSRGGHAADVLLDLGGAIVGVSLLLRIAARRKTRPVER